jgi:chitin disaccharide deacetylase
MAALMINADDWGVSLATTDAIARCFDAGAVTAASAMVHMADSARAAALAGERRLPAGLHLNLSLAFDGADVPDDVRRRQALVAKGFANMRLRRWIYDPSSRGRVARAIADQLEEFERLYGAPPTRLDGHLHVHLCPDVLFSRALPREVWLRPARTAAVGRAVPVLGWLRRSRERWMRRRFAVSDYFFSIEDIHPQLGGSGLDGALDLAAEASVEVMTHPSRPQELALLLSPQWRRALAERPLGAFPPGAQRCLWP